LHIALPLDAAPPALNVSDANGLTPRERDVLELLAGGARNKAIGAALTISENTVKFHVANLLHKTGTTSRSQLVALVAGSPAAG
jgi:DNA-binding CsgD family transcriptional regulator